MATLSDVQISINGVQIDLQGEADVSADFSGVSIETSTGSTGSTTGRIKRMPKKLTLPLKWAVGVQEHDEIMADIANGVIHCIDKVVGSHTITCGGDVRTFSMKEAIIEGERQVNLSTGELEITLASKNARL